MSLINSINPKTFWQTLTGVIRHYSNLRFYKKKMRQLKDTGVLSQNGMKLDNRCRAYYVLNLEPEILMMGDEALELEQSRVYESIASKSRIFSESELTELVEAATERIKTADYYAYLIQIKYRGSMTLNSAIYCILWLVGAACLIYSISVGLVFLLQNAQAIGEYLHQK